MDKKIGVSILFSFLILMGLIGVSNAIINSAEDSTTEMLRSANITLYGDGYGVDNGTKGGVSEIMNLTILYGGANAAGASLVTVINISWAGNYSFTGFIDSGDNEVPISGTGMLNTSNGTIMNGGEGDWFCNNISLTHIGCTNESATAALSSTNTTLILRFNVTATASIEDKVIFTVNTSDSKAQENGTYLTAVVDGLAPRMIQLNVSDGNATWNNGSFNGSLPFGTYLDSGSPTTITATFYELNPSNVMWLQWNGSEQGADFNLVGNNYLNSTRASTPTRVNGPFKIIPASGYSNILKYTWTIPANSVNSFGTGAGTNTTIAFAIIANDTHNNIVYLNDTSDVHGVATRPFSIAYNDTLPHVTDLNLTDAAGNSLLASGQLDASGDYLSDKNVTIKLELGGFVKPLSNNTNAPAWIFYNTTGSIDHRGNAEMYNFDARINLVGLNTSANNLMSTWAHQNATYETSIDLTGNDSNTIEMYVAVGNMTGDFGYADNLPGNYTLVAGPYRFTVDGGDPSVELSTPTQRGITTSESVTYTCTAIEGGSGVESYIWTITKPNGDKIPYDRVYSGLSTNTKTFRGVNIGTPGTYSVECKIYDAVGNEGTATTSTTNDFRVSVASSNSGGSGGTAPTVSFDIDFTATSQATLKSAQGRIKSFSFDGITKHTITFNEVTATTATLIIASDPVTINLNVGQSKEVDVNGDGVNDMKVILNSIANSVADITVEKIEVGAEAIKREEREARGLPPTEEEVTPVAAANLAWLWWTLLVIAVIVVIGYVVNKRK